MRHGLALAAAAAAAPPPPAHLRRTLLSLLRLPAPHEVEEALALAGAECGAECEEWQAGLPTALQTQPQLLRSALLCAAAALRAGAPGAAAAAEQLTRRCCELWAAARAAEAEAAVEAASEFRVATRSLAAAAAEAAAADEEAHFRARFAASAAPFADLQEEDGPTYEPQAPPPATAVAPPPSLGAELTTDLLSLFWQASGAAACPPPPPRAVPGPPLPTDLHLAGPAALGFAPHGATRWAAALRCSRERFSGSDAERCARGAAAAALGGRLLASAGGGRGDLLEDGEALGGAALALALAHARLAQGQLRGAPGPNPWPQFLAPRARPRAPAPGLENEQCRTECRHEDTNHPLST